MQFTSDHLFYKAVLPDTPSCRQFLGKPFYNDIKPKLAQIVQFIEHPGSKPGTPTTAYPLGQVSHDIGHFGPQSVAPTKVYQNEKLSYTNHLILFVAVSALIWSLYSCLRNFAKSTKAEPPVNHNHKPTIKGRKKEH